MDKQLFAKLNEDGELLLAPHHYQDDEVFIMNFDECEELLYKYGYKPVKGKEPHYNPKTQDLIITYKEEKSCIRKTCEVFDKSIPQFEEVNIIDNTSIANHIVDENLKKENEELKQRIENLERKQQEMLNLLNSFINECSSSLNKVNELDDNMTGIKKDIKKFNNFIDFYNDSKR